MAPEYAADGLFSVKSDVFSFGVIMLEIITGRRSRGFYHPSHSTNLIGYVSILFSASFSMQVEARFNSSFWYISGLEAVERRKLFGIG